jgi:hypothetical protein
MKKIDYNKLKILELEAKGYQEGDTINPLSQANMVYGDSLSFIHEMLRAYIFRDNDDGNGNPVIENTLVDLGLLVESNEEVKPVVSPHKLVE